MARRVLEMIQRNFRKEGPDGGKWEPLSPRYRKWKESHVAGMPILTFWGRLRGSMADANSPEGVFDVTDERAKVGTRVPYAGYHQSREKRTKIPRRAFLDLSERDVTELRGVMMKWAVESIRKTYASRKKE